MCHRLKGSIPGLQPMQPDEVRLLKAYLRARPDSRSSSPATEARRSHAGSLIS
jgi:hypothetical protein